MNRKFFQKLTTYLFLLGAFVLFSTQVDAQSKKDQRRAKQLVEQADNSFRKKDYRGAVNEYQQAVTLVPTDAYAHFWKGLAHHHLNENDLALPEFELALSQGHKKPLDVYLVRWRINYEKKEYDAALDDAKRASVLAPNNVDLFVALGDIYLAKGDYKEASDAYQKAILQNPKNADLYYNLALAKSGLGDTEGQGAAADEAVRLNAKNLADSYRLLADARQKQRRFADAIDAYKKALLSKPDIYEAYKNLAEIYRSENRIDDAIDISKRGLAQFPNDGKIYTDLSWFYSVSGRNEDAVQAGLAGTRLLEGPVSAAAYTNLCRAYNDVKKPEMAITACNSALRFNPDDGETHFYIGRAHDLAGKTAEATKYYKRAVTGLITFTANNPESSDGFYLLGNAYFADNQREKAIEAYKKCLELNPRFAQAKYNIGIIQVLQKNKVGALEQYNSLLVTDKALAGKLKTEIDKL